MYVYKTYCRAACVPGRRNEYTPVMTNKNRKKKTRKTAIITNYYCPSGPAAVAGEPHAKYPTNPRRFFFFSPLAFHFTILISRIIMCIVTRADILLLLVRIPGFSRINI